MPSPATPAADCGQAPLVLTMGDPAGIGPDITIDAWLSRDQTKLPPFIVIGDADIYAERAALRAIELPIARFDSMAEASADSASIFRVLHRPLPKPIEPGRPDAVSASATVASIEEAVEQVQSGAACALVTNPINKKLLYEAGFEHPGHTEFLGELACRAGDQADPVMMLACDELRVIPVTIHIPLRSVAAALSPDLIGKTIQSTAQGLRSYFQIAQPRIAVAGLNPHAGEMGAIGDEEETMIAPAIKAARQAGIDVIGPFAADTLFSAPMRTKYDVAVAMYHDQALIPIKALAFERAVNVTLGLPFVRTSPDHGTAYELAGSGRASAASLVAAIRQAAQMTAARRQAAA